MIRMIYIYLYRYLGEPRYVGQTPDIERRDRAHQKNRTPSSFERLLANAGREKFTLEIIGQVEDLPHGAKANELENRMMDQFVTYRPGELGFNQSRAGIGNHLTEERYAAMRASQSAFQKTSWVKDYDKRIAGCRKSAASVEKKEKHRQQMLMRPLKPWEGKNLSEDHRRAISCSIISSEKFQAIAHSPLTEEQKHNVSIGTIEAMKNLETREKCKLGGFLTGLKNAHRRWHLNRGIWNPSCKLCFEVM